MSIVLNEREWAIDMVDRSDIGKKPSETLRRVARVYIDDGMRVDAIRKKLSDFIIRSDPGANPFSWDDAISRAIASAQKYPAIHIDEITVSKTEIAKIDALSGKQVRRLAFTLLCLAKYWNIVRGTDDCWVNNRDNEIMQMANINTSIKRQSLMYYTLKESGMVQFSKMVDNTNVKVCFADSGKPELTITDFRNLGYQYLMYHGEPYFTCQNCGVVTRMPDAHNVRRQKYCKECAAEIAMQQKINSVMRHRRGIGRNESPDAGKIVVYMHEVPNGKRYIGTSSTTLSHRWKRGFGYDTNSRFWADITKYGWDNIKHYWIAAVDSMELAKTIESLYIKKYRTTDPAMGYNRSSGDPLVDIPGKIEVVYPPKLTDENGLRDG